MSQTSQTMQTTQINSIICNKCFAPIYRGIRPYHITQCGHVFCQNCVDRVLQKCPQCQRVDIVSLALEEPLIPKVIPYFEPLIDSFEMLLKVIKFRTNQMNITMKRFYDLDKKYDRLKTQYWLVQRNMKMLSEKVMSLKIEKDKLDKKLILAMQKRAPKPCHMKTETPCDSGISMKLSNSGYSMQSKFRNSMDITPMPSKFRNFTDTTPMRSDNLKREHKTIDGFRMPIHNKIPKSVGSSKFLS